MIFHSNNIGNDGVLRQKGNNLNIKIFESIHDFILHEPLVTYEKKMIVLDFNM